MYHGRFKGTHYEAGHKWGELLYKNNNIISNKHTFVINEKRKNLLINVYQFMKTTNEVIENLKMLPIASQQTLTIADSTGDIVVVECNSKHIEVIKPNLDGNFIATANEFNSQNMKKYNNYDIDLCANMIEKTNADTVWSVIYDIKNKKVYRVEGNPSRKKFKEDTRLKFN